MWTNNLEQRFDEIFDKFRMELRNDLREIFEDFSKELKSLEDKFAYVEFQELEEPMLETVDLQLVEHLEGESDATQLLDELPERTNEGIVDSTIHVTEEVDSKHDQTTEIVSFEHLDAVDIEHLSSEIRSGYLMSMNDPFIDCKYQDLISHFDIQGVTSSATNCLLYILSYDFYDFVPISRVVEVDDPYGFRLLVMGDVYMVRSRVEKLVVMHGQLMETRFALSMFDESLKRKKSKSVSRWNAVLNGFLQHESDFHALSMLFKLLDASLSLGNVILVLAHFGYASITIFMDSLKVGQENEIVGCDVLTIVGNYAFQTELEKTVTIVCQLLGVEFMMLFEDLIDSQPRVKAVIFQVSYSDCFNAIVPTTLLARKLVRKEIVIAFRSGHAMGLIFVAIELLYASVNLFELYCSNGWGGLFEAIAGFGFCFLAKVFFCRVGVAKAADVGNKLARMLKRNVMVVLDNGGDNVGGIVKMRFGLFESYVESSCAILVVFIYSFGINLELSSMSIHPLITNSQVRVHGRATVQI